MSAARSSWPAWQLGQPHKFPSATRRAFVLLFPDLFGLKCGVIYTSSLMLRHLRCTRNRLMGICLQLSPSDTQDLCQHCH